MNYFTAMANSPTYEFPYSGGYQAHTLPNFNNDIDALLASITSTSGPVLYNQPPPVTLQCVPQPDAGLSIATTLQCVPQLNASAGIGNNTMVYQVPEDTPLETILQQLGVSTNTLQPSGILNNYYRSASQPMEILLPPSPHRRRRLVCHEVSDSDDDNYHRRPSHHHHHQHHQHQHHQDQHHEDQHHEDRQHPDSFSDQSPMAIHDLLGRVWNKAKSGSRNLQSSSSAPNLNSQWQAMRSRSPPPPPPNARMNNAWQTMRNAPPPMSPDHQDAVSSAWHKAEYASELNANRLANTFNRMRQPTGSIVPPPPPPQQNREAVQNFFSARNLPYGVNIPPPPSPPPPPQNREAVQNFFAARNLPYGVNIPPPPPQNREAVQNFFAARNLPYGVNIPPPPPQNREAVQNFFAARNVPYGVNVPPPGPPPLQNREAVQNFNAARNLPYGVNSNPAVANVWQRADSAVHQGPPPMSNTSWNRMPPPSSPPPPPMNASWNPRPQGPRYPFSPSYGNPPYGMPQRRPFNAPAPTSFAAVLSQAHRQRVPYAGYS